MAVTELERQIRRGLLGLLKLFRRNRITVRGFLKMYPERFITRSGYVSVKDSMALDAPAPDAPALDAPALDPLPGTPEFQALSLPERLRITDARTAARAAARRATAQTRLSGLSSVYRG